MLNREGSFHRAGWLGLVLAALIALVSALVTSEQSAVVVDGVIGLFAVSVYPPRPVTLGKVVLNAIAVWVVLFILFCGLQTVGLLPFALLRLLLGDNAINRISPAATELVLWNMQAIIAAVAGSHMARSVYGTEWRRAPLQSGDEAEPLSGTQNTN